jgi:hypothetical protein
MKKITASILCLVIVLAAGAQSKVTKTNVVGKWVMYSVEVPGQMHYNIDKDSLALSDAVKASIESSQLASMMNMVKQQFAMFTKVAFQFKADGTAELTAPTGEVEKGTYAVDEKNSTITSNTTTTNGEKSSSVLSKAKLLSGNKLEFYTSQGGAGGGEVHLVLKKAK